MNWTKLTKDIGHSIVKHQPKLLIVVGACGMLVTTAIAVHETPKAMRLIEQRKKELEQETLSTKEVVKTAWKCYVPAVATGAVSVGCLLGGDSLYAKRGTALAAAYTLSETALREYKGKIVETLGAETEQTVRDAIAKDRIAANPVEKHEVIIADKGDTLFYDSISGRYFKSNVEAVKKAENLLNRNMLRDDCITLNELYYELGLDGTSLGDTLGWRASDGLFEIEFSAQLSPNNTPCVLMDYNALPSYV